MSQGKDECSWLSEVARQQESIRRAPGAQALGRLAVCVAELTGADVVAAGLFEAPGVLRVTAHAGLAEGLRPDIIKVDDGRVVDPVAVHPGTRDIAWAPLRNGPSLVGGVVVMHEAELPPHTPAMLQILAATAADTWERLGPESFAVDGGDGVDRSPFGISKMDLRPENRGQLIEVNRTLASMFGYDDPAELIGLGVQDWTPSAEVEEAEARLDRLISGAVTTARYGKTYKRRDGSTFPAIVTTYSVGLDGDRPMLISHVLDITRQWTTALRLNRSERQFQAAFELAPYGMMLLTGDTADTVGTIVRVNDAMCELLLLSPEELIGRRTVDLLPEAQRAGSEQNLLAIGRTGEADLARRRHLVRADGTVIHILSSTARLEVEGPEGPTLLAHVQDVTQETEHSKALARLARTDPLTGVGNRTQLNMWLAELERGTEGGALLVVDLDRFKSVNDQLGHHVGDELLVAVTERLTSADPEWKVSRLGGDEFVLLVSGVTTLDQGRAEGDSVAAVLNAPFQLPSGATVKTSVSIGVAVHEPGLTGEEVQRRADLALYRAKSDSRSWVSVCDAEVLAQAKELRDTEAQLRDALQRGAVEAWLQPIVELRSRRVIAYEALARVIGRDGEPIPAYKFIKVAESVGLISELDHHVVADVARLIAEDERLHDHRLKIAVNVSSQTLTQPTFLLLLGGLLNPDQPRLVLEVTEHSLLEDDPQVQTTFAWLRDAGIDLAVDDFGTGYSALAYLQRFRMQHLKVDRSFVQGLGKDLGARTTVHAVIDVAHAHGMTVVAEGIETEEQAQALLELGAEFGQGYLFGRPSRYGN